MDIAVVALAAGGSLVGVPLAQNEKQLVKSLVGCAVVQPVADCARDELVDRLPPEAQALARCLLGGQKVQQSARAEIISNLSYRPVIAQQKAPSAAAWILSVSDQ